VKNFEQAQRLLQQAEESLEDMERALQRSSWNMVLRRGQEAVELALKGLLSAMAIEYPRVHDGAQPIVQVAQERRLPIDPTQSDELGRISARLARSRAPAFYAEQVFDEEEALDAAEDVRKVMRMAGDLVCVLQGQGPWPK
jgi:HEPN domain-containing protein